jgi:hypothetical protein
LDEAFVISDSSRNNIIKQDPKSAEIIFPYVTGKEIKRDKIEWEGNWIIFTKRGIDIKNYPVIEEHLRNFQKRLEPKKRDKTEEKIGRKPGNYKWYEIQDNTNYWKLFLKEGIIYPRLNKVSNFAFSPGGYFPNSSCFYINSSEYWLMGILNSKIINFYLKSICPFMRGEYYDYRAQYVTTIPISNKIDRKELDDKVKMIIDLNRKVIQLKKRIPNRLSSSLHINKFSNKLRNFTNLEFNEFLKEITYLIHRNLTLKEQDEWEEYFNDLRRNILELEQKINNINLDIDESVYKAYSINSDERKIIEKSL